MATDILEGRHLRPEVPLRIGAEVDEATVQAVERQTRGQMKSPKWFSWRQYRITASIAHTISHSCFANGKSKNPPKSCVNMILGESSSIKTKGMKWGIRHEAKAVKKYQELKSTSLGRPVKVQLCGFFIDPQRAWLGASPDRIVEDEQTGELCLEVICPHKHRRNTVREACLYEDFCLELDKDQTYRLKTNHKYYTQVQCQMGVTGIHMADLAVFTLKDTVFVPVFFDPEYWEDTVAKLEIFYREFLRKFPNLNLNE